jgi:deazaflavin-dependent oxidoreductase (nitroreductase family)
MAGRRERGARRPFLPPRWFVRTAWVVHKGLYGLTGGRRGLWPPRDGGWGTFLLTTTGRHTGRSRQVILGYIVDGDDIVTMAMNGWGAAEPAWWLNLQATPDAEVVVGDETRAVRARAAVGEERERLWDRWRTVNDDLDAYAALRPRETAVVVLEPRPEPGR